MAQMRAGVEELPNGQSTKKLLKRELTLLPLFGLIYFTVCGGSFGAEPMVGLSGPGLAILLFFLTPLLFSVPNMLMVREMQSMMPVEGGYYHWLKKAFGAFIGFMGGWMNWVVAWVDVSIYPVYAAYYLGFFIPALRNGATIAGVDVSGDMLSWLVALVLIWAISYLNIRGARLSGLTTDWLGAILMIPMVIMSIMGLIVIFRGGAPLNLPFLATGEAVSLKTLMPALSTGLFVAMWNFMGWELPAAAGDEIVKPKKTYPLAMILVLVATIATYSIPTIAGLYGGAGEDGKYQLWGLEATDPDVGIVGDLAGSDATDQQKDDWQTRLTGWGVDPASTVGWEFPDIARAVAGKLTGQPDGVVANGMGVLVTLAAVLSMVGLFIGNGIGGTRVPYAMAEDGMMPRWMVKVHPKYGTPWVAILICGVIFSIFSLSTFQNLVVIDVFLNCVVLMAEFFALWVLRFTIRDVPRSKVPGGYFGLTLITLAPLFIIVLAIYSQITSEGPSSILLAIGATIVGVILYFPLRKWVKPGVPDVDPFVSDEEEG
jgi:amino acid transporter